MQISVPVTFDATNQTMSVSDSSLITFPQNTSDFSIVTVNGMDCITPTTVALSNGYVQPEHYIQFTVSDTVEEVEFDSYADISGAPYLTNLWIEFYSDGRAHQYSLVYGSGNAKWLNPDNTYANLSTQQWYSIKIVNNDSIKFYNKSTGTLVYSRSFIGKLSYINLGKFYADTNFYLTSLTLKRTTNTEAIRYANTSGIAEIWANIKNWVLAHIGNGTLYIRMGGVEYQFKANQGTDLVIEIPVLNNGYGISSYGLAPYGGYMEESEAVEVYNGVDEIGNIQTLENARIADINSVIEEDIDTGAGIGTATTTESASTYDEV